MQRFELSPFTQLLTSYAPAWDRDRQRLCWALDQRLAQVVRGANDPTIAAIRMAWWDGALVEDDRSKGNGEPLVEAWRLETWSEAMRAATGDLIDGWRTLLGEETLSDADLATYAARRGAGLFTLLAGEARDGLAEAGAVWALWDLAGHVRDEALAMRAFALARERAALSAGPPRDRRAKPLRLAWRLALADIDRDQIPRGGFLMRHYRRLLLFSLVG